MSDSVSSVFYGVKFGSEVVATVPDSISVSTENQEDEIFSGAVMRPYAINTRRKRPSMQFSLLDPTLISDWTPFGSTNSISSLSAHWRQMEQNGSVTGSWRSITLNQGVIIPTALHAESTSHCTLQCVAYGAFSDGVGYTIDSGTCEHVETAPAWYSSKVVIGSTDILSLESVDCSWTYDVLDDNQNEPEYYTYRKANVEGSASALDQGLADVDKLVDGVEETVDVVLQKPDGTTATISMGKCLVRAAISGSTVSVSWKGLHE